MKKITIILAIIIAVLLVNKEAPKESIRFRIIANSNQEEDQRVKKEIIKTISKELLIKNTTIEEEREYLKRNIPTMEEKIKSTTSTPFTIHYGENYFPQKEYNNKTYKEGFYESLVITLGEGMGENFWCILFPPLCMIDEEDDVEYKSFLKESLTGIFGIK